jgi:hypothetical protein
VQTPVPSQEPSSLEARPVEPARRTLLLVAGSGRSGTSLFTGILQRLGFHVPKPEVPADDTNPRGFAESQWVVDFHTRLLRRARVQVADARPTAWADTANVGLDEEVQRQLRDWLETQFRQSDDIVIKDPRLSWFLPLWQHCAESVAVSPRFVTVLRHPAAVIDSKQRWYGGWQRGWQGDVARAAGWINQTLFTERATREAPRAFVRYDDLLEDWTQTVGRVAEALDLAPVRDASPASMREVHDFVDGSLSRSSSSWDNFKMPTSLREQADEVWELVSRLADDAGPEADSIGERLEAARIAYVDLYEEAEAIAQSSIAVAGRRRPAGPDGRVSSGVVWLARRVPQRYRHKVPVRWRQKLVRVMSPPPGSPSR